MWIVVSCLGFVIGFLVRSFFSRFEMQRFMQHFQGLSADIIQKNSEHFLNIAGMTFEKYQTRTETELEKTTGSISSLISPVKESLEKVDAKILELEKARIRAYAGLEQQVEYLLQSQKDLRSETANLVKALRQPAGRGRWGEIQLKRVVEMAGMLEYCDFSQQETIDIDGGRLRPDLIVRLPGDKRIIVDAKAPLDAYLEAIETTDEAVRNQKMMLHARQVRHHINELGKKGYWEQFIQSPEFVILFLPGEPFFSAALQYDAELIEAGVEQKVILATPTTLIALLRAANYGWRQERIAQNAEEIGKVGRELYKRLCDMNEHWSKVGRSLQSSIQAYNQAVGSFEKRVLPQARRFKDLKSTSEGVDMPCPDQIDMMARQLQSDRESINVEED